MRSIFQPPIVIHRRIAWLLLFSIVTLGLASWLIYLSKENIDKTNFRISQTHAIIETMQEAVTALAESGTVPVRFLDSLQQLTGENKDLQQELSLLATYINEKKPGSTIKELLYSMLQKEKELLTGRKHLNEQANQRTVNGMIIARTGAFICIVIFLLLLNRDITRHKATQQKLTIAMEEAQQAKKLQEQFLANMSHEIRTPMNGIKGMTDLLLETPLSEKQTDMARMIKRSVNNLLVIINDILDFSKIQAGKLQIEKIDLHIPEVVNSAAALFEHRLKKKGLQFCTDIAPGIPDRLTGDPYRLNQVLTNLLGNAIKFTDKGQIKISVAVQEQTVDKIVLMFTVADTGIGIPEDSMPYIFNSFSQAGQDISRRYGGTGLGLTICKQLLQLQDGNITVKSTAGKGSEFQFYLPFGYSNKTIPEISASEIIRDDSRLLAGKRFLVAEDNEINQKLIEYVLTKAGAGVTITANGALAVNLLQHDKQFDLIIMDLQMPEMDGYAATRYIRNNLLMKTPIIAMTATAMKDEQWQCLDSGMNDYMTKPFEFAELYKRIMYLLQ